MKKQIIQCLVAVMLVIGMGSINTVNAAANKPPRPEKIEEVKSDQPSQYHRWITGKWKWKRKTQEWQWRDGYWTFDHDLYAYKNRFRYHSFYRPYRLKYYAIPIGRGLYRIVAL